MEVCLLDIATVRSSICSFEQVCPTQKSIVDTVDVVMIQFIHSQRVKNELFTLFFTGVFYVHNCSLL